MRYNLRIKHKPGIHNRADALSRCPDYAKRTQPEEEIGLPDHLFIHDISALDLDDAIRNAQTRNHDTITQLLNHHPLTKTAEGWTVTGRLVVVGNNELRRGVISLYHDFPTAGHPGGRKTLSMIARDYWWPEMRKDITEFVKGCAICQSTKSRTTQAKPPLYPIATTADTLPFETIALDFITKLPKSGNNDTILSITDQGCFKATIFLPCAETIDVEGTARIGSLKVDDYLVLKLLLLSHLFGFYCQSANK